MVGWLIGRVGLAVSTMLGVATVVFVLLRVVGDPLAGLVPPGSAPDDVAALRASYGLDRPLPEQYAAFVAAAARGDFGESWRQGRPALAATLERLPATAALVGLATLFALAGGAVLGVAAGSRPGGWFDAAARLVALTGQAIPAFWLGTMLILLFAVRLGWLPASGLDGPASLLLPAATLAAFPLATIARLVRASTRQALAADYVRTARGKGLAETTLLRRHVLRNALLPTLGFVGFQAGFLLGGAAVVEAVFAYPGMGLLALNAVADRDLPVVQAFVAVVAALLVGLNLLVDLGARWLDPRLRTGVAAGGVP
jgi:peptide/nickel transport system permease protein